MNWDNDEIKEALSGFSNAKIAVIGDLMLDTFTYGHVERMSPEAPVPVVLIDQEKQMLGGAGNVANNIVSLGGEVFLYGRIGNDSEGKKIRELAESKAIVTEGIFIDNESYPTIEKRRVLIDGIHSTRIDRETFKEIEHSSLTTIITQIERNIESIDAFVICDYAKGVITEKSAQEIILLAQRHDKPLIVDTKPGHHTWFNKVTLITPNEKELTEMANEHEPHVAAKKLQLITDSPILVTRGPHGMTLIAGEETVDYPATESFVVDVSGAGDTVVATITLALSNNVPLPLAAKIANYAAGIAVAKPGTAEVSQQELIQKIENDTN